MLRIEPAGYCGNGNAGPLGATTAPLAGGAGRSGAATARTATGNASAESQHLASNHRDMPTCAALRAAPPACQVGHYFAAASLRQPVLLAFM